MAIIMTWRETKDAGKQAFSEGDYPEALSLYSDAVDQLLTTSENGNHVSEHQILLSNVIACRLKIGGEDMVGKAVDEAKEVCLFFLNCIQCFYIMRLCRVVSGWSGQIGVISVLRVIYKGND